MTATNVSAWSRLPVSLAELCIDTTLRCGQSFRWRKLNDEWFEPSTTKRYTNVHLRTLNVNVTL